MSDMNEVRQAALNAAALVAAGSNIGRRPQDHPVTSQSIVKMAKEFEMYLQGFYAG